MSGRISGLNQYILLKAVMPVRLEPATSRSRVKHPVTAPPDQTKVSVKIASRDRGFKPHRRNCVVSLLSTRSTSPDITEKLLTWT